MMLRSLLAGCLAAGALSAASVQPPGRWGGELRFCLKSDPKTFNPVLVEEEASEVVRYLTAGVLIRLNRLTQELEPELAESWKVLDGGRRIAFKLRAGIQFSDGSPFSAEDVAFTMRVYMDPSLHSPTGDPFRTGPGEVRTTVSGVDHISITFPAPVADLAGLFDQVAILSSRCLAKTYAEGRLASALSLNSKPGEMAVLGPYRLAEYKPGVHVLLTRNPYYWKRDASGRRLPYIDSVLLLIQQNRELEVLRFLRGEIHLINTLPPDLFDRVRAQSPQQAVDGGPGLEFEQLWFNQVASAAIPGYKKEWFRSQNFRRAISQAINRADICRLAYGGRATPAAGPISPANKFWFNARLKPEVFDRRAALKRLEADGFRFAGNVLRDRSGHLVEFSIITNAGNKTRERIATMIQQDLWEIGIRVNVVTLDFPSLIERISRNFNYEACLLGMMNVDLDPDAQMNVWLSSASNHQWNPNQKSPETSWEAEIDRLMLAQAVEQSPIQRKAHFDKVQEIIAEQAPFIYLVHKNSLAAVSLSLRNVAPSVLYPQTFWNIERLYFAAK